jgi:hypothetical protein
MNAGIALNSIIKLFLSSLFEIFWKILILTYFVRKISKNQQFLVCVHYSK